MVVYGNALAAPFVFDDLPQIVASAELDELWPGMARFLGRQRTFTTLTFALNRALGGDDPSGYRAVNVLVHVLAGLALFAAVRRALRLPRLAERFGSSATGLAFASTWLWLLHPLQTQSVTYVVQRAESLTGLFYLLALYATIRSATTSTRSSARRWQILALLACVLGMGSKPVMATAPLVILTFDRLLLARSWRELARERGFLYAGFAASWLVIGASGLVSTILGTRASSEATAGFGMTEVGATEYLLTQPGVVLHYLRLALWPDTLVLDYGWPMADSAGVALIPGLALGAALIASVAGLARARPLAFLGVWFFAILGPTSSFVPLRDAAFEHRMYLPLAALTTGAVLLVAALLQRRPDGGSRSAIARGLAAGTLLLAGAGLGARTWARNGDYRDEVTLWRATVRDAPENGRGYNLLALALAERGLHAEGVAVLETGLQRLEGRADAERQRGSRAVTHNTRGNLLRALGRTDEAIAQYRIALELDPHLAEAHCNWGAALRAQGRYAEALERYETALRMEPDEPETQNNLSWLLATCRQDAIRDGARALDLAGRAAEATRHREPSFLDTLAAALAEEGEFEAAVSWETRAIELAPERERAAYRARLETYRNGRPLRE